MSQRENDATVHDQGLEDAFMEGFNEGRPTPIQANWAYTVASTDTNGDVVRTTQFGDLALALEEAREFLLEGPGVTVTITCSGEGSKAEIPAAATKIPEEGTDVVDAEVVSEEP